MHDAVNNNYNIKQSTSASSFL